jgi:hypothetical protein
MKYACVLIALAVLAPARAAALDMATQTCQDWLDSDDDQQDEMTAWLRGFIAGRATSTLYEPRAARSDIALLKVYCQSHKEDGLISAASQWKR